MIGSKSGKKLHMKISNPEKIIEFVCDLFFHDKSKYLFDMDKRKKIHLALFFKDFAVWTQASCVGLNVAGFTTAKFLKEHGIDTHVFPVRHNIDIVNAIDRYNETHIHKLTHVVISAPWLTLFEVKCIIEHFRHIQFVILSHSNVGFLQADPCGVELLRNYSELSKTHNNIHVGGNCTKFVDWFEAVYNEKCVFLPNIYPAPKVKAKVWDRISPIKIGAFGAIRPEKNFMTAAAGALAIHSKLKVPVEVHMSTGGDGCKSPTLPAIEQMMKGIEGVKLVRHDWQTWNHFIKLIESMDLLIQVSYTESFNMVTADGISVGVSSVVSPVIYWAPDSWKADPDDALDVTRVGIELLLNKQKFIGSNALLSHNEKSIKYWLSYLEK